MKQSIIRQAVQKRDGRRPLVWSAYLLTAVLGAVSLNVQANEPLSEYEKLLMDEADSTEMKGSSRAADNEVEPPVAPTTTTDPEVLAQEVSSSLEKLLESGKSADELEQAMSGVVSDALGKGVDLNALRSLVDNAMEGVKQEKPELVSVEEAGATLQNIIEANRRLIEGDPGDDYIKLLNSELSEKTPELSAATERDVSGMPSAENTLAAPDAKGTHTVRPGETLSYIAKKYYGNAGAFTKIYQANRETLSTPNLVLVGQRLVIPE